ncbi:hypothetical protein HY379_01795 [Candidatus Saccharibacteria bacterium]|nr:hypothetical protein [Candidatus Saccharibacteria bacterium]
MQERPKRAAVPTNEFGVVLPPPISECIGQECQFKNGYPNCILTRHHLHSSEPFYETAGRTAAEYRDLAALTVWIPECQHKIYHRKHEKDVPIPDLEVMKHCVDEARKLRVLKHNTRSIAGIDKVLAREETPKTEIKGTLRYRDGLIVAREKLIDDVLSIEVIPEELVTGALLTLAPNHARSRIIMGSDFVLPGLIVREQIPKSLEVAYQALEERNNYLLSLQTEVVKVELAA